VKASSEIALTPPSDRSVSVSRQATTASPPAFPYPPPLSSVLLWDLHYFPQTLTAPHAAVDPFSWRRDISITGLLNNDIVPLLPSCHTFPPPHPSPLPFDVSLPPRFPLQGSQMVVLGFINQVKFESYIQDTPRLLHFFRRLVPPFFFSCPSPPSPHVPSGMPLLSSSVRLR